MTDSRNTSEQVSIDRIINYKQSRIHTSIPAHVVSYDSSKQTVNVEIPFKETYETTEGIDIEEMGIIHDVPVQWPRGGGGSATFPLEKGDLVLLVFAARSIEDWYNSDGVEMIEPRSTRMHDKSDAFAIAGISTDSTALSSDAVSSDGWVLLMGDTRIEVKKSGAINTRCDRLNIGSDSAGTALANGEVVDSHITDTNVRQTTLSAIFGLPPVVLIGNRKSTKAFTND